MRKGEDCWPARRLANFTYLACVPRFIFPLLEHAVLARMLYRDFIDALLHLHPTFTLALLTESRCALRGVMRQREHASLTSKGGIQRGAAAASLGNV